MADDPTPSYTLQYALLRPLAGGDSAQVGFTPPYPVKKEIPMRQLLSSDVGQKALRSVHTDQVELTRAISNLSDAELARLAERAQQHNMISRQVRSAKRRC